MVDDARPGQRDMLERAAQATGGAALRVRLWNDHGELVVKGLSLLLFLGAWEWASASRVIPVLFLSSPSRIYAAGVRLLADGALLRHVQTSAVEFALGYSLGVVAGVALGVLTGWYRRLRYALDPFVTFFYVVPSVSFLPLVLIWFGIGLESKVVLVFMNVVFVMLIATLGGIRSLDEQLVRCARSYGASEWQVFATIALPASVPHMITGLKLAAGPGLVAVVVAELIGASSGIGYLISSSATSFLTDRVYLGILVLGLAGMALLSGLGMLERRFDAWRPEDDRR
jgi:ABC-type nitrate/sulfonate/bicarbonate transport system permease component